MIRAASSLGSNIDQNFDELEQRILDIEVVVYWLAKGGFEGGMTTDVKNSLHRIEERNHRIYPPF